MHKVLKKHRRVEKDALTTEFNKLLGELRRRHNEAVHEARVEMQNAIDKAYHEFNKTRLELEATFEKERATLLKRLAEAGAA